jgi:DNA-binding transcriptional MerR regulator
MNTNENLFPISELSNLTGVNTVTIRAWERRYGLLKPKRTNKGHRLYDKNDIQTVHTILAWINKGVSVGKVKPLLQKDTDNDKIEVDEKWLDYQNSFIQASKGYNESKLESLYNEMTKQYPLSVCIEYCLQPLFQSFDTEPNASVELQFLYATIKQRMSLTLMVLNRKLKKQPPVTLFLHASNSSWKIWLAALINAENNSYTLVFEDISSLKSIVAVIHKLESKSALIYSGEKTKLLLESDIKDIQKNNFINISGPEFWLNKNQMKLKEIKNQIVFSPIQAVKKQVTATGNKK